MTSPKTDATDLKRLLHALGAGAAVGDAEAAHMLQMLHPSMH